MGVSGGFDCAPVHTQVVYGPAAAGQAVRSREPLFYLVRRGSGEGTLDQGLKRAALAVGVTLRLRDPVHDLPDGGIVAHGPRRVDALSVGYLFETDAPDGAYTALDNALAPKGYAYLLVSGGRATLATCMFADFRDALACLGRSLEFFRGKMSFAMRNVRRFGGYGNMTAPRARRNGGILVAGEAAGFQDALWGFGIRSAILSGQMAARSWIEGSPGAYERLWRKGLGWALRTSVVNRFAWERSGHRGYEWALGRLARSRQPRAWLRKHYGPRLWKAAFFPIARRLVRVG